jgi:hypothetical protein
MVTYCIETAVLEATRPIGAKAVAVANKANKAASLNIIIIFDKSILIVRTNDLFFPPNLGTSICMTSGRPDRPYGEEQQAAGRHLAWFVPT